MAEKERKYLLATKKDLVNIQIRKKLGVTQAQLAAMLNISRTYVSMSELGSRNLHSTSNILLTNIFLLFQELETGKQASERSVETMLFLNDEYKKILPKMKLLEQDCRSKIKLLKKDLEKMKESAKDAENAIIVFTTVISNVEKQEDAANKGRTLEGLQLFKQKIYLKLLTCWEPEQAKLHSEIEAIAGKARSLRRYRVKVIREHNPFKK